MKVVLISDTHCQIGKVNIPKGDILIHAGDLTYRGGIQETTKELVDLAKNFDNFKHIVLIDGNHDFLGEDYPEIMEKLCKIHGLTYLNHSSITLEGLNIFGSAFTPEFCDWAFNVPRGAALKRKWDQIPENTDILVTHGPPKGILDECPDGFKAGCEDLWNRVNQLANLKIHVFGHIHGGYGTQKMGNLTFVNASICTEGYKPTNKPIIIEL